MPQNTQNTKRSPISPSVTSTETMKQLQKAGEQFQASLSPDQRKKQEAIQKKYAGKMQVILDKMNQTSTFKEWQNKRDKAFYSLLSPAQRQKKSEIVALQTKMQTMQRDTFTNMPLDRETSKKLKALSEKFQKDQAQLFKETFSSGQKLKGQVKNPKPQNYEERHKNLLKQYQENIIATYPSSMRNKMREISNINNQYNQADQALQSSLTPEQRKKAMENDQRISKEQMAGAKQQQAQTQTMRAKYDKEVQGIITQQIEDLMPSLNPKQQQMLKEVRVLALKMQQEQNRIK
jgi:hypothetical protein